MFFRPSFQESHLFVNFDVIVRRKVWKLEEDSKIQMEILFLLPGREQPFIAPTNFNPTKYNFLY